MAFTSSTFRVFVSSTFSDLKQERNALQEYVFPRLRELHTLTGHTNSVDACAFSPYGQWIVSASDDKTLKVWEADSGMEKFFITLLGEIHAVDLHRWKATTACGDAGGNPYLLDLVGIAYGPSVVTAAKTRQGLVVRCPACQQEHTVTQQHLGTELTCPQQGCNTRLKINPFVNEMAQGS